MNKSLITPIVGSFYILQKKEENFTEPFVYLYHLILILMKASLLPYLINGEAKV